MQRGEYLAVAVDAARAAGEIIRRYYDTNLEVDYKEDRTPVTIADLEAEKAITEIILRAFPDHGIWSEESGTSASDGDFLWLIDPLDGTKNFIRQNPVFSTQIALLHRNELLLGVSNAVKFDELVCAQKEKGACLNGRRLRVSGARRLSEATLSLGNIQGVSRSAGWSNLGALVGKVNRVRGYGDFLHYHLLASGKLEIVVESDVNVLDVAALAVIVREAGGVFTDLDGNPLTMETRSVLATNSTEMHEAVMRILKPGRADSGA